MASSSLSVHIFPLISVFGLYAVASFFTHSGLAAAFTESRAQDGPTMRRLLPDGATPVRTSYTGLPPLDAYLANLQYIFVPVVDGSSWELSLLGWHWGNLLLVLFTVMLGESLRTGRRRDLVFFGMWGLAIQYCGYFVTMPVYCYVHLLSSSTLSLEPTATATNWRMSSETATRVIPIAVFVGYVLPSVAMSLSLVHSGQSRQAAVAIWQNFPFWIAIVQWALTWPPTEAAAAPSKLISLPVTAFDKSVARINRAVALVSGLMHVSGLMPILLATLYPEQLITLSPVSLDDATLRSLQADNFFLPPKWDSSVQISNMAEGAGNFLRYDYYIGTAAALLWAAILQATRGKETPTRGNGRWLAGKGITQALLILTTTVVLGPGFTIASLMI